MYISQCMYACIYAYVYVPKTHKYVNPPPFPFIEVLISTKISWITNNDHDH